MVQEKAYFQKRLFKLPDPTKSLREFKREGYKTHLFFVGMNSIEECIQRVSLRVQLGGHKVSEESIVFNFRQGYANLYIYFTGNLILLHYLTIPYHQIMLIN